jgi:L-arabinokinase
VCVRTSAPAWLFERALPRDVVLLPGDTDPGVVQVDSLRLDEAATIEDAARFYGAAPAGGDPAGPPAARLDAEIGHLTRHGARLVIADAPPLACAAARAAGIPAVVCANFTWDWIYQDYAAALTPAVVDAVQDLYKAAAEAWRLPMHGGFDAIGRIVDVPLVARHAARDRAREELRRALGIPPGGPVALVSFGGYGVRSLPIDRLDCTDTWRVVFTGAKGDTEALPPGIVGIEERQMYARGFRYEDLVRAADVVVTKPGYGIISDCAANGAAVLYTSRGRFAEYDVLVREMPRFVRSHFIPMDDLLNGRWKAGLEGARAAAPPAHPPATNGADVVAELILRRVGD